MKAVRYLVPQGCVFEAPLHTSGNFRFEIVPVYFQAISDILKNSLGKGVRLLKDHSHPSANLDDVHLRTVDVPPVKRNLSLHPRSLYDIIHPVQATEKRGLSASGGSDEGRHTVLRNLKIDIL
jgi:hypothetical protein